MKSSANRAAPAGEDRTLTAPGAKAVAGGRRLPALAVGALGVVFGDVGTSPLYAFELGDGLIRVTARYGFMEQPQLADVLRDCERNGSHALRDASYFVPDPRIERARDRKRMWPWRRALFAFMLRTQQKLSASRSVPTEQIVEIGIAVLVQGVRARGRARCIPEGAGERPWNLATIDDGPRLTANIRVAGIVALLVAKGWKIGERHEQGAEAFAEVRKDIGDVYRLLQASDLDANATALRVLRDDRRVRDSVRTGVRYLRELCTGSGAGLREFGALVGSSVGGRTATASLAALVEEFVEAVESVSAEA